MKNKIFTLLALAITATGFAQEKEHVFTEQDTLRGSITPERAWWDLTYYDLNIKVDPAQKFISGSNTIQYKVLQPAQVMQIDLQVPMKIEKVTQDGKELQVRDNVNAHFVTLEKPQKVGDVNEVVVTYSGNPREAVRAPWDGGFSWTKDENGNDFVATSCQGLGASVWWPNKDHMYDEVDSMAISVKVPKGLMDVSNGRLRGVDREEDGTTYHWFVDNPINNYGVNVNIGDYVHFGETYPGEKGPLSMDYYVLKDNLEKAKEQFKQAPKMMKAFEYWFGPYPFYEDGYKLVEVPYLGMEHQSSVTYGNHFANGYLGHDLSRTGWGLKWDYILVHESGHEWFANNITYKDIADMWVHESFTTYSEGLFVEYYYGKDAGAEYIRGLRHSIRNEEPIIGKYNVNNEGSGDMYPKGANMLHTIRQVIDNDSLWHNILRGLNKQFYHQTVTTKQIEDYLIQQSGKNLVPIFNEYLRSTMIPVFEYELKDNKITYHYTKTVEGFDMPIRIFVGGKPIWLDPHGNGNWKTKKLPKGEVTFDPNFYVVYQEKK